MLEKFQGILYTHVEHIADALAFVANFERFTVEALSLTGLTVHVNIWQEVHLNDTKTSTFTSLAAPAFHVERETTGLIATNFTFRQVGKELSYLGPYTSVGCWIRTRGTTDWTLVDIDDFINLFSTINTLVRLWLRHCAENQMVQDGVERAVNQCTLTTAANSGNTSQNTQRNFDAYIL